MGHNVRSAPQVRALTGEPPRGGPCRRPSDPDRADQEGGRVRRFRWAPPVASAEELGRLGEAALRRRGRDTARALDRLGVDVDLAPVADVPGVDEARSSPPSSAASRAIPNRVGEGGDGVLRPGCSTAASRRR